MNLRKIVIDARALLETGGWTQGKFWRENHDGTRAYCASGAIEEAIKRSNQGGHDSVLHGDCNLCIARCKIDKYAMPFLGEEFRLIPWNDNPQRTKEEVIILFHQLATVIPDTDLV